MIRKKEFEVNDIFINRWSPRALSKEKISEKELITLFEAAKWAPSAFNAQPWRFIYAEKDTEEWENFFSLLVDFNKEWAKNASILVIIVSRKNYEHNEKFSKTHSFDTGAAWQNLALQASMNGLIAHGMGGFDEEKARIAANIPEEYEVQAMIAIGKPGKKEDLPKEMQEKEILNDRKKVSEFVFKGKF